MKAPLRSGISGRFGLALLIAWPALVAGLSATGERIELIYAATLVGLLPALVGAVAWLKAGQDYPKVFVQKRIVAIACIAAALTTPFTHWPLRLSLISAIPICDHFQKQPRFIVDCWIGPLRAKYASFDESGDCDATLRSGVEIDFFHLPGGGVYLKEIRQPRK